MKEDTLNLGKFCGSTNVGVHGQVVIPAEVRHELGIEPGIKLLVFAQPRHQAFILIKVEALHQFVQTLTNQLGQFDQPTHGLEQNRKNRTDKSTTDRHKTKGKQSLIQRL